MEVLSESTERIDLDRREKLFAYTGIDSLQSYLLLSQDRVQAELHRRADNWKTRLYTAKIVVCPGYSNANAFLWTSFNASYRFKF